MSENEVSVLCSLKCVRISATAYQMGCSENKHRVPVHVICLLGLQNCSLVFLPSQKSACHYILRITSKAYVEMTM